MRVDKRTVSRQNKLKDEIYTILKKEAHQWFSFIESRDNTLTKRLGAIEKAGVPDGVLEQIRMDISGLRYTINKQTKVIQSLLDFLNASKLLNIDGTELINNNIYEQ